MTYAQQTLLDDLEKMRGFATVPKPQDLYTWVQWEMARTHVAIIEFWLQVQKQFRTTAPIEDAENFLGFAKQWVRTLELHHQIEEEIQFLHLNPPLDTSTSHDQHTALLTPLRVYHVYLESVSTGIEPWSASKAETLAQALLPILMHHFVEELHMLDPERLCASSISADTLEAMRVSVATRAKEIADPTADIPPLIMHNGGALDWPPVPWVLSETFKMPMELYLPHKGWWKYAALPLNL
ncbi:hypothetical protein IEO21_08378 [Rhodonia placenta]|uniref:Hemerythrin-like domain-containing protein n=1 Tax=Rhodonia placenta TaxID=104341 RepID=A0A8H7TZA3_9APHY|nr:hypothetical protein IEO21_08378 [Postia placenta]